MSEIIKIIKSLYKIFIFLKSYNKHGFLLRRIEVAHLF